jgi:hypothetical protein
MEGQLITLPDTPILGGKSQTCEVTDINIDVVNKRVRVLYFVRYFNDDNTEFKLPGTLSIQSMTTAGNESRINPLTGEFLGNDVVVSGSVGEYDFLRMVTPAYIQTLYPQADTMGGLIDALVDLMILRLYSRGGIGLSQ